MREWSKDQIVKFLNAGVAAPKNGSAFFIEILSDQRGFLSGYSGGFMDDERIPVSSTRKTLIYSMLNIP